MERSLNNLTCALSKVDRRHIQLILTVGTLILFVLGAGAPGSFGDFGN